MSLLPLTARANIIGSELQNFNPSMSVVDFATVHSTKTLGQGRFSLGLFVNNATNTLPYFNSADGPNDTSKDFSNSVTGLDVGLVYGILDNWDLALTVPYIVAQSERKDDLPHGYFSNLGITEIRFSTKVRLIDTGLFAFALVGTANYNRVIDNPYTGNVPWPSASLEAVAGLHMGPVELSANLGRRWRNAKLRRDLQETLPVQPYGDQYLASAAVAVDLPGTDIDAIAELYGADSESNFSQVSARKANVAESLVGIRYPLPHDFQLHAGVGAELNHSLSSADQRIYLGLRWMVDPFAKKKEKEAPKAPDIIPASFEVPQEGLLNRNADAVVEVDDIFFQFDSTDIRDPRGYDQMQKLSAALLAQTVDRVVIEGNACALGTDEYNLALSEERAEKIERLLVQQYGVAPEKLVSVGWGERHPKYSNATEATRMLNRRVTFRIYYRAPAAPKSESIAH